MTTAESLLRELVEACEDESRECEKPIRYALFARKVEICKAARRWLNSKDVADAGIGRPMRNGTPE